MLEQGQYHQAAGQPGTSQLGLDTQWTGMFIVYADVAIHLSWQRTFIQPSPSFHSHTLVEIAC